MLWDCRGCGTRYAESLASCPHCGSTERIPDWQAEEEENMPKISSTGLATGHADRLPDDDSVLVTEDGTEAVAPDAEAPAGGAVAGGETGAPADDDPDGSEQPDTEAGDGADDAGDEPPAGEAATPAKRAPKPPPARKASGGGAS